MAVLFSVPGEPGHKGRPRFTRYGHTYTDKKTVEFENLVRVAFTQHVPGHQPYEGPCRVHIDAYFSIPKSASKKRKKLMIDKQVRPTKKPDCDNIAKAVLDALNSVAYNDDKQVIEMVVRKWYSDVPRTIVMIEEV